MLEISAMQSRLKKIGLPQPKKKALDLDSGSDIAPSDSILDMDSDDDLLRDTPAASVAQLPPNGPSTETTIVETQSTATVQDQEPVPEPEFNAEESAILNKCLKLWTRHRDPLNVILSPSNTMAPTDGVAPEAATPPSLVATTIPVRKNPKVLKGGYLLVPNSDSTRWVKRFAELRRPYLHIHSVTDGDEVAVVSLRNSRVDSQPGVLGLLQGSRDYDLPPPGLENQQQQQQQSQASSNGTDFRTGHRRTSSGRVISTIWTGTGGGNPGHGRGLQRLSERLQAGVFAIYGTDNTWLFAARSERDKLDWILRIDQSYVAGSGTGSPGSPSGIPGGLPEE